MGAGSESSRSDERERGPLVIVHLMKTGGFSLAYNVMANVSLDATWGMPDDDVDELERMSHYSSVEQLRDLDEAARSRLEVVMGHLPFAVVEIAGLDQATIATVVREPVDRVISYLKMCKATNIEHRDLSLEEIYRDEYFRPRMILNHQTKMLGMSAAEALTRPPSPEEPPHPELVAVLVDQGYFESAQFAEMTRTARFLFDMLDTPVMWPVVVDGSTLDNARANLERVDVLGIYEEYDDFLGRLGDRMGWTIDRSIRANQGASADVSQSFRRRIEEENALDLELYEHALAVRRRA